jgi:hypothetical protein
MAMVTGTAYAPDTLVSTTYIDGASDLKLWKAKHILAKSYVATPNSQTTLSSPWKQRSRYSTAQDSKRRWCAHWISQSYLYGVNSKVSSCFCYLMRRIIAIGTIDIGLDALC